MIKPCVYDQFDLDSVELRVGVRERQGTLDSLCGYYSAAMLMEVLFPQIGGLLRQVAAGKRGIKKSYDPILNALAEVRRTTSEKALAAWFYGGIEFKELATVLNRAIRGVGLREEWFVYRRVTKSTPFSRLVGPLEQGLPFVLGWDTTDFNKHAVLVKGYSSFGKLRFLSVEDPSGELKRISFEDVLESSTHPMQVVAVRNEVYKGDRPDRVVFVNGREQVERWWCVDGVVNYFDLDELRKLVFMGEAS